MWPTIPTDYRLRILCSAVVFVGLGFLCHPESLWGDYYRLMSSVGPRPTFANLTFPVIGFAFISWFFGAAIETALVTLGLRLSVPRSDEQDDYDDRLPDAQGSS